MASNPVFVTGGTGSVGRPLIAALLDKGYSVHALGRPGAEAKLPQAALPVIGNALDASSFASAIPPAATLVPLVGTPHPNPTKVAEFRRVDLASIRAEGRLRRPARTMKWEEDGSSQEQSPFPTSTPPWQADGGSGIGDESSTHDRNQCKDHNRRNNDHNRVSQCLLLRCLH